MQFFGAGFMAVLIVSGAFSIAGEFGRTGSTAHFLTLAVLLPGAVLAAVGIVSLPAEFYVRRRLNRHLSARNG
jgi:hypothetical protein